MNFYRRLKNDMGHRFPSESISAEDLFAKSRMGQVGAIKTAAFFCREFEKKGKKIFSINKNLMDMMIYTDVNNVEWEFVKFPYQSFLIELPSKLKYFDNCVINSIGVCCINGDDVIFIFEEDGKYVGSHIFCPDSKKSTIGEILDLPTEMDVDGDDASIKFKFMVCLLTNFCLYLSSSDADLKADNGPRELLKIASQKKNKKRKSAIERLKDYPKTLVGSKIIIDKRFREIASNVNHGAKERKLKCKFTVRGHWRTQRYGEANSKAKKIWIKPFIKGRDSSNLINKKYEVRLSNKEAKK